MFRHTMGLLLGFVVLIHTSSTPFTGDHKTTGLRIQAPTLRGTVLQQANCRYGPGAPYLYTYGLWEGWEMEIIGRDVDGDWLQVQALGGDNPCWVNGKLMQVDGDVMTLPDAYPITQNLPISDDFEQITITSNSRGANGLTIAWLPHTIRIDLIEEGAFEYIVEVWTCVVGTPTFEAIGTNDTIITIQIDDSCGFASHADVIGQDQHGFSPPAVILAYTEQPAATEPPVATEPPEATEPPAATEPPEQNPSICGWIENNSQTGALAPYMTLWDTSEVLDLAILETDSFDQLLDLGIPGYFQIDDPVIDHNILIDFSQATKVESCDASVAASPMLRVIDIQIEPAQVSIAETVTVKLLIENKGAPLNEPYWEYTGEVILENEQAEALEHYSFEYLNGSTFTPVIEAGKINLEKWLITVRVKFSIAVTNGTLRVIIQSAQLPSLESEGSIVVKPGPSVLSCISIVANKLGAPFSPDTGKDIMDASSAELQALACKDDDIKCQIPPLVKGATKVLVRLYSDIKKIPVVKVILGIWSVFDTDALEVCRDPAGLMWQMIREFNREGVAISAGSVHSPMLIMVTNSAGQRAGFVSDAELVNEIQGSQVVEWDGGKFVLYPADSGATVSLKGTGEGTATIVLVDGQSGREISYKPILVIDGSEARIILSDAQQILMSVDNNGDGAVDQEYAPNEIFLIKESGVQPGPVPGSSSTSVTLPSSGLSIALIALVLTGGAIGIYSYTQLNRRRRPTRETISASYAPQGIGTKAAVAGEAVRLVDGMLIGRGSDCDLRLLDRAVSRQHARIRYAQGQWFIQDMESKSGTYVNNVRVNATVLKDGDHLRIGSSKFEFRITTEKATLTAIESDVS